MTCKLIPNVCGYRDALKECSSLEKNDKAVVFSTIARTYGIRAKTLRKYFDEMKDSSTKPSDFGGDWIVNGRPPYLCEQYVKYLETICKVMDLTGNPVSKHASLDIICRLKAKQDGLTIESTKLPSTNTWKKILKQLSIKLRKARLDQTANARKAKTQDEYIERFYSVLRELYKEHGFKSSQM